MDETTIVFDVGSGSVKVGYAGDDAQRAAFSTVVGVEAGAEKLYIGDQAQSNRERLILRNPIQHGVVNNWDDMEKIYHHTFNNVLGIAPEEHLMLLTEPPLNPKLNCDKTAEMMFETFNVPALNVSEPSKLVLYASGRQSGIVVSSGDGVSCVVPIYEWKTIEHAVDRMNLGGRDLDEHLAAMMRERGYDFTTSEVGRDELKRQVCYVALDYNQEMENGKSNPTDLERDYVLPDGRVMTIGEERFRCPEALFKPSLLGLDISDVGIHKMTAKSISKCEEGIRAEMYANIVMNGGSTLFTGTRERMKKEITAVAPTKTLIGVCAPPERMYSVWIGGSIFASLAQFKEKWMVSKEEYNESGPSIVYQKCLSS